MNTKSTDEVDEGVRFEPEDRPPVLLMAGLGCQFGALVLVSAALIPSIVYRSAGTSDSVLSWAIFSSLVACGLMTILQATRFGARHVVVSAGRSAAIAVCITALVEGGPLLLALLTAVCSLFQLLIAARLSLFRQVLTPTIAGTVIMLIPVGVMPVLLNNLERVPEGVPLSNAGITALVTVLVMGGIMLKGGMAMRLWAPLIGVGAGAACAFPLGLFELDGVAEARWFGLPLGGPPALDPDFGPAFWALLPAFLLVTLIGTIQSVSSVVAVQRASWRRSRAINYRSIQNSVALEGLGNLFCALIGTMPKSSRSSGASFAQLTGVASRRLGIAIGVWLTVFAFIPKALAVVLAIPGPVLAAFGAVMMAILFMVGVKLIIQDGLDYRKTLIVGVSFWMGAAMQNGLIFPEQISVFANGLLKNGMTAGGITVILLTLFVEFTSPRPSKFQTSFTPAALRELREFLSRFATRNGWDEAMAYRLDAASEETLLTLLRDEDADEDRATRRLLVTARKEGRTARLEFLVAGGDENLQDRIALMEEQTATAPIERDVSLRLLRHLASSVRHQQYHDTDIVTVHVEAPVPR